jgi:hypothetical protein
MLYGYGVDGRGKVGYYVCLWGWGGGGCVECRAVTVYVATIQVNTWNRFVSIPYGWMLAYLAMAGWVKLSQVITGESGLCGGVMCACTLLFVIICCGGFVYSCCCLESQLGTPVVEEATNDWYPPLWSALGRLSARDPGVRICIVIRPPSVGPAVRPAMYCNSPKVTFCTSLSKLGRASASMFRADFCKLNSHWGPNRHLSL